MRLWDTVWSPTERRSGAGTKKRKPEHRAILGELGAKIPIGKKSRPGAQHIPR